jgi:hypothetical protein
MLIRSPLKPSPSDTLIRRLLNQRAQRAGEQAGWDLGYVDEETDQAR